jgi:hypothetical protein
LLVSRLLTSLFNPEDGSSMFLQNSRELYQATWHNIPEDSSLHTHCHENMTSHKINIASWFGDFLNILIFYILNKMLCIICEMPGSRTDLFISVQKCWHLNLNIFMLFQYPIFLSITIFAGGLKIQMYYKIYIIQ